MSYLIVLKDGEVHTEQSWGEEIVGTWLTQDIDGEFEWSQDVVAVIRVSSDGQVKVLDLDKEANEETAEAKGA